MIATLRRYICAVMLMLSLVMSAHAQERILNYVSDITVKPDSTMLVTESITVWAENEQINHGIYRDFPTQYRDRYNNRYVVGFTMLSATRDGAPEKYRTTSYANGKRVYLGDANTTVSPGQHTYALTYETNRQLGFFPDHDELYWNVTGNGWVFTIAKASATITLPPGIPHNQIHVEGYTGQQGAKGQNYRAWVDNDGKAHFMTTQPLGSNEGLTIVVAFPKGYVTKPSAATEIGYLLRDNRNTLVGLLGLLFVVGWFLFGWFLVGRDPTSGIIIPRFEPPVGFSPAALRFIRRMGYDNKTFATAIINAAVKGYITITEIKGSFISAGKYSITQTQNIGITPHDAILAELNRGISTTIANLVRATGLKSADVQQTLNELVAEGQQIDINGGMVRMYTKASSPPASNKALAAEESTLLASLFGQLGATVVFDNDYYKEFQQAIAVFRDALRSRYQDRFFVTNTFYFVPGVVISVIVAILSLYLGISQGNINESSIFSLMFIGVPFIILISQVGKIFTGDGRRTIVPVIGTIVFLGLFIVFSIRSSVIELGLVPWGSIIIIAALLGTDVLFYYLLKAPTPSGRKLMDEIEGFRMYLEIAEKDELNLKNPPEKTPELFEKYLPYALALDVEQAWGEKFTAVLARASAEGHTYHPSWYTGMAWSSMNIGNFASSMGNSFSNAISSSSTAPSSSSGSGGGGSSGGGGGGGGGGGW